MALNQMSDFTFKHTEQVDDIYTQLTAEQIKQKFDSRGVELRTALNNLIAELASINGASDIGAQSIADIDGATVQALIQSVRDKLKATADGSSGADFVSATAIDGISGGTVQALLEALKAYVDTHKASADHDGRYYTETETDSKLADLAGTGRTTETLKGNADDIEVHKASADHDGRYVLKTALESIADGSSGADQIKATPIATGSGDTVQTIMEWLLSQIAVAATGSIPDGTLGEAKLTEALVTKINTALSNTGVLTTLTTTDKSSAVNAINEVNQKVDDNQTAVSASLAEITQQLDNYSSYASVKDSNGIYTVLDYKRADATLYMKSTLSNADSNGNYQTNIWQLYNVAGDTVIDIKTWTIAYDVDGNIISKVVS